MIVVRIFWLLSEFSDCVDIFKKEQVEKIHNQKILIVAGFFATEAFFAFFSKKKRFLSLLLMFENTSWMVLSGHNQKILIVAQ